MDYIIRTENICRDFSVGSDVVHALKDINICIEPGKFVILKGRSGSGKTTLINLLGALDKPTRGKVFFCGRDLTLLSPKQSDDIRRGSMGFVFQSVALISTLTAYENVEFGLRVANYDRNNRRKRALECLDLVGLGKRTDHYPEELSGGEQQRVAIARAIAHMPDVLFADEPTAELDTHMGLQVIKVMKDLVRTQGVTIVMTTHDPNLMELADKVYTLEDGEVVDG